MGMLSGDLLREARCRAGLSQAALARRAGKPTSVIGRWERGEVRPSFETLQGLIRACGLDLRFIRRAEHSVGQELHGCAERIALRSHRVRMIHGLHQESIALLRAARLRERGPEAREDLHAAR